MYNNDSSAISRSHYTMTFITSFTIKINSLYFRRRVRFQYVFKRFAKVFNYIELTHTHTHTRARARARARARTHAKLVTRR